MSPVLLDTAEVVSVAVADQPLGEVGLDSVSLYELGLGDAPLYETTLDDTPGE